MTANQEGNDYFFCGDRADSMATTSRYIDLRKHIYGEHPKHTIILSEFVTDKGYRSHPSPRMPANLQESSISSDTALPFFLATEGTLKLQMWGRIKYAGWRTGDGKLVEPMFFAVLINSVFLMSLFVLGQALVFKFPWRWDDGQRKIVSSRDSSCDYLNWFHVALRCPRWVRRSVSKEVIFQKLCDYYKEEPNSSWLILLYDRVMEKYQW